MKYWLGRMNRPRYILAAVVLVIVILTFSINFQRKTSFMTFVVQRPLLHASAPQRIALEDGPWPAGTQQADLFPGSQPVIVYTKQGAEIINGFRATGDFDGDGEEDVIEGSEKQLRLSLSSREEDFWQITQNKRLASVGFDDIDGDGHLDLWWLDASKRHVGIIWGSAEKLFNGSQIFNLYDYIMPESLAFYDIDQDGHLDMLLEGQGVAERHNDPDADWPLFWLRLQPIGKQEEAAN